MFASSNIHNVTRVDIGPIKALLNSATERTFYVRVITFHLEGGGCIAITPMADAVEALYVDNPTSLNGKAIPCG